MSVLNGFKVTKKYVWDKCSWPKRMFLVGATISFVCFPGQAVGVAAFGRAIAVPMWSMLGASGASLGILIDDLEKYLKGNSDEDATNLAQQEDTDV